MGVIAFIVTCLASAKLGKNSVLVVRNTSLLPVTFVSLNWRLLTVYPGSLHSLNECILVSSGQHLFTFYSAVNVSRGVKDCLVCVPAAVIMRLYGVRAWTREMDSWQTDMPRTYIPHHMSGTSLILSLSPCQLCLCFWMELCKVSCSMHS